MKKITFFILLSFMAACSPVNNKMQPQEILHLKKISHFSSDGVSCTRVERIEGKFERECTNNKGQLLYFRFDKNGNLNRFFEGPGYFLVNYSSKNYYFFNGVKNAYIQSIYYFDMDAKPYTYNSYGFGQPSYINFNIIDKTALDNIMVRAEEHDGNVLVKDRGQKLIVMRSYNKDKELIKEKHLATEDFIRYQYLISRPR